MLLDLEQPDRILAELPEPVLETGDDDRDGYVPNVVYSCGAMRSDDHLVVPYGVADQRTAFATFSVAGLLDALMTQPARS